MGAWPVHGVWTKIKPAEARFRNAGLHVGPVASSLPWNERERTLSSRVESVDRSIDQSVPISLRESIRRGEVEKFAAA